VDGTSWATAFTDVSVRARGKEVIAKLHGHTGFAAFWRNLDPPLLSK